ncbi:hemerythrin domain-containing protein [Pseudomonas sp. PDM18]|uniref:hemerythrin domain-containing protein n=1 Tax=unclassified Pseudomonas TaxID=196821 RepID=UPI00177A76FF|nr:hemerythrin domain-containing protein [Pseudomonas sp. PDM18]MBD9677788.1 hemerythrin domain-containing protein [Pseudomonas sp. PDM18]
MNAIELLKHDHEVVKKLLGELSETTERAVKKRPELLRRIELELAQHTSIEEEIFYPALKQVGEKDDAKMYFEAKEEHRTVDALVLPDLKKTRPDSIEFAGRVKVLKELLEHHIEEEEQEMFPRAAELLDHPTLDRLGAAMQQMKKDIKTHWEKSAA